MVAPRHGAGSVGRDFPIVSSSESLPCSISCMTAAAVNCLVIEPMRYTVCAVAATSFSTSERP